MSEERIIADSWVHLSKGCTLFLAIKHNDYLCEGPFERLDLELDGQPPPDQNTEACVRLFFTPEECDSYCAIWRELLGVGPNNQSVRRAEVTLEGVWMNLSAVTYDSYNNYAVPARIDLCRMTAGGYPAVIDTIFSERAVCH